MKIVSEIFGVCNALFCIYFNAIKPYYDMFGLDIHAYTLLSHKHLNADMTTK